MRRAEPDLLPTEGKVVNTQDTEEEGETNQSDQCSVGSDSDRSNKYFTCGGAALSDSEYGTMDELCQMRGTDEYECRVERMRNPAQPGPGHGLTGLSSQVYGRDTDRIS